MNNLTVARNSAQTLVSTQFCGKILVATNQLNRRFTLPATVRILCLRLLVGRSSAGSRTESGLLRLGRATMPQSTPLKRCSKCEEMFPATSEYFHRQKTCQDGLRPDCKKCACNRVKVWEQENPDKVKARQEQRKISGAKAAADKKRYTNHKQEILARQRQSPTRKTAYAQYRATRRALYAQLWQDWYSRNKEVRKAYDRAYKKVHQEEYRVISQRRSARKRALPDTLTYDQWLNSITYWQGCCAYCGKELGQTPTVDHWIPLNNPSCPGTVAENIVPACVSCNCSKNDTDPLKWLSSKFGYVYAESKQTEIATYFDSVKGSKE